MQSGAFTWLEKPCADDKLLDTVGRALDRAAEFAAERRRRDQAWERLTPREMDVASSNELDRFMRDNGL